MNKIIYFFILLLLFSCGEKQLTLDNIDANEFDFRTLPKSCIKTQYKADFKYGNYETGEKQYFGTYSFSDGEHSYQHNYDGWGYGRSKNKKEISETRINNNDSTISKAIYSKGQFKRVFVNIQSGDSTIMEIKDHTLTYYYPEKSRSVITLNSKGQQMENIYYNKEGQLSESTFFTYNDKNVIGNISYKDAKYEFSNFDIKYEYLEFDKKGNWVKRLEFHNGSDTPEYITIREIKY